MRRQGSDAALQGSDAALGASESLPYQTYQRSVSSAFGRSNVPPPSSLPYTLQRPETTEADRRHVLIATMLERVECAYLVIDQNKRIVETNAAAQRMLDQAVGPTSENSHRYQFVRETINRCRVGLKLGSLIWIATSDNRDITSLLAQIEDFTADQTITVILLDLDVFSAPNPATLRRLFGLTFAECRLAFHLAQGRTPKEVASLLGVSRATVGSQLGAVFSKTHTKRQAELVALLGRIAVLP